MVFSQAQTIENKRIKKLESELFTMRVVGVIFQIIGAFIAAVALVWTAQYGYETIVAIFALCGTVIYIGGVVITALCLNKLAKGIYGKL